MAKCPHRIRVRRLIGCDSGFEYVKGSYICVLEHAPAFKGYCTDTVHKECYYPAMTKAERIQKLKEMGQQELDEFV